MLSNHTEEIVLHARVCEQCDAAVVSSTIVPSMTILRERPTLSDTEAGDIRRALQDENSILRGYEDAISDMSNALRTLRSHYARLRDSIHRKVSLLSPIWRLPHEVLARIFVYAIIDGRDSRHRLLHPVLRVCHLWRELALATSALWVDIALSFRYDKSSWTAVLTECLRRAKAMPLSISLKEMGRDKYEEEALTTPGWSDGGPVPEAFLATAQRWRRLRLCNMYPPAWLREEALSLPVLECLELRNFHYYDPSFECFEDCPALSTVYLKEVWMDKLRLPWAQLTSLELQFVKSHESNPAYIDALQQCKRLQKLTLAAQASARVRRHFNVVLPSLAILCLIEEATDFLPRLLAPSLSDIRIRRGDLRCLLSYATSNATNSSTITSLSSSACRCQPGDWVAVFELYTNVSSLSVDALAYDLYSMAHLATVLRDRPDLLPDLTSLSFPDLHIDTIGGVRYLEDIVDLRVHSRPKDRTTLTSLSFGLCHVDYRSRLLDSLASVEWTTQWTTDHLEAQDTLESPYDDESDDDVNTEHAPDDDTIPSNEYRGEEGADEDIQ
ncbi:hypothetical protein EV715DRAFT_195849 [Schizophyllum commune]